MRNEGLLIGMLVEEPVIKAGTDYCRIVVASSYYTKAGKQVDYIPFFLRGQDALNAQKYLGKGAIVSVDYKLKHRKIEKGNEVEYRLDTLVKSFQWISRGRVDEKVFKQDEIVNDKNDTYEDLGVVTMPDDSGDLGFM